MLTFKSVSRGIRRRRHEVLRFRIAQNPNAPLCGLSLALGFLDQARVSSDPKVGDPDTYAATSRRAGGLAAGANPNSHSHNSARPQNTRPTSGNGIPVVSGENRQNAVKIGKDHPLKPADLCMGPACVLGVGPMRHTIRFVISSLGL
jgi:hypothetical protein